MQENPILILLIAGLSMFGVIGLLAMLAHYYTLNGIKSRTVGDGQHGTARWATKADIRRAYSEVAFEPEIWRQGKNLPSIQGLVVGWHRTPGGRLLALHASRITRFSAWLRTGG